MGLGWQVPPAGPQAMAAAGPISVTPGAYSNPSQGLGVFTGNEISSISITPSKVVAGTKNNKQTRKKDDEANYTTIMLRNIPNKYSRQMLIDQLHSAGFLGQIDYLYLPIDFANRCNVGYCFINFRTSHARQQFSSKFDGVQAQQCLPGFNSYKVCQVTKAKWQGRDENVRRIRSGPELMQQLAGHPDWLPVLLDEQGQQEPFQLEELPGKQAAQKGRNNKKQILAPGALRPDAARQVPLSDLLQPAGKKNMNAKTLQGAAKSKNTKNKQPKGPDVVPHPMVQRHRMTWPWRPGVPMPMMPGGLPLGFMPSYDGGVDSNVLMGMNMMHFSGNVDMSQYMNSMAAFGPNYYANADAFDHAQFEDLRVNDNQEDEDGDVLEDEEEDLGMKAAMAAMNPSYIGVSEQLN